MTKSSRRIFDSFLALLIFLAGTGFAPASHSKPAKPGFWQSVTKAAKGRPSRVSGLLSQIDNPQFSYAISYGVPGPDLAKVADLKFKVHPNNFGREGVFIITRGDLTPQILRDRGELVAFGDLNLCEVAADSGNNELAQDACGSAGSTSADLGNDGSLHGWTSLGCGASPVIALAAEGCVQGQNSSQGSQRGGAQGESNPGGGGGGADAGSGLEGDCEGNDFSDSGNASMDTGEGGAGGGGGGYVASGIKSRTTMNFPNSNAGGGLVNVHDSFLEITHYYDGTTTLWAHNEDPTKPRDTFKVIPPGGAPVTPGPAKVAPNKPADKTKPEENPDKPADPKPAQQDPTEPKLADPEPAKPKEEEPKPAEQTVPNAPPSTTTPNPEGPGSEGSVGRSTAANGWLERKIQEDFHKKMKRVLDGVGPKTMSPEGAQDMKGFLTTIIPANLIIHGGPLGGRDPWIIPQQGDGVSGGGGTFIDGCGGGLAVGGHIDCTMAGGGVDGGACGGEVGFDGVLQSLPGYRTPTESILRRVPTRPGTGPR